MKNILIAFLLTCLVIKIHAQSIDDKVANYLNHNTDNPVYSMLLYVADDVVLLDKGYGVRNTGGTPTQANDQYRIASSTKTLVATIVLQMVEEGKISLDDVVADELTMEYIDFDQLHVLNGVSYGKTLTVEQLLSHRSGLADIFTDRDEAFFELLMQDPSHTYSPREMVDIYYRFDLNENPHFAPGEGWQYSDMNYVLLGLLIESKDGVSLAQAIRNRILEPLEMRDTYFEYYEGAIEAPRVHQYFGSLDMTEINTSFDWGGGGLVSTNQDMATFINGLFNGQLISKKSLKRMTDAQFTKEGENKYGLGMYESVYNGDTYYGHYGFYGSYVGYSPKSKKTIVYCITQAMPDFNVYAFINEVLDAVE